MTHAPGVRPPTMTFSMGGAALVAAGGAVALGWWVPGLKSGLGLALAAWLWWNALCFGSLAVLFLREEVFGKAAGPWLAPHGPGHARWFARGVLLPYRVATRVFQAVLRWKDQHLMDPVAPGLLLGGRALPWEGPKLLAADIGAVIDLCAELPEHPALRKATPVDYLPLYVADNSGPDVAMLRQAVAFAARAREQDKTVLVHCAFGHGRSAVAAAAILVSLYGEPGVDSAVRRLKQARPSVAVGRAQQDALRRFEATRNGLDQTRGSS